MRVRSKLARGNPCPTWIHGSIFWECRWKPSKKKQSAQTPRWAVAGDSVFVVTRCRARQVPYNAKDCTTEEQLKQWHLDRRTSNGLVDVAVTTEKTDSCKITCYKWCAILLLLTTVGCVCRDLGV